MKCIYISLVGAVLFACQPKQLDENLIFYYYPNGVMKFKGIIVNDSTDFWDNYYADGEWCRYDEYVNNRLVNADINPELIIAKDTFGLADMVGLKIQNSLISRLNVGVGFVGDISFFLDVQRTYVNKSFDLILNPVRDGQNTVKVLVRSDNNGVALANQITLNTQFYVKSPSFTGREDRAISIGNYMSGDTVGRDIMLNEGGYKVLQYYYVDADKARDDTLYLAEEVPSQIVDLKGLRLGGVIRQRYYKQDETAMNAD